MDSTWIQENTKQNEQTNSLSIFLYVPGTNVRVPGLKNGCASQRLPVGDKWKGFPSRKMVDLFCASQRFSPAFYLSGRNGRVSRFGKWSAPLCEPTSLSLSRTNVLELSLIVTDGFP